MSTLSALRTKSRLFISEISSTTALSNANLDTFINEGAREFVKRIGGIPTSGTFDVTADTASYALNSILSDYWKINEGGLWWQDSSDKWHRLQGETRFTLQQKQPFYLNSSSGTPMRYFIEGNTLYVHPPPETTDTDAFQMFYDAQSVDVASADETNYIITNSASVEYSFLIPYEDIFYDNYVRFRVFSMLGNRKESAQNALTLFYQRCEEAKVELQSRPDLKNDMKPWRAGQGMQMRRASLYSRGR